MCKVQLSRGNLHIYTFAQLYINCRIFIEAGKYFYSFRKPQFFRLLI